MILLLLVYNGWQAKTLLTPDLNDFGRFWRSAFAVLQGQSAYAETQNLNPPHIVWLTAPLAALRPLEALGVWAVLSLLAATAVVRRLLSVVPTADRFRVVAFILALSATGVTLKTGQISFLLAWPIALSWLAKRAGRTVEAGIWLGLGIAAKPFLLVFPAYWGLRGNRRAALAAVAAATGAIGFGIAAIGLAPYREWAQLLSSVYWAGHYLNVSAPGAAARWFGAGNPHQVPLYNASWLVMPACGLLVAAILGAAWRWSRRKCDPDREYLGVGVLALLLCPLGWSYYFWLFLGPLCVAMLSWLAQRDARSDRAIIATVLLCVPAGSLPELSVGPVLTFTIGSAYFWAAGLILWNLVADARTPTSAAPSAV